MNSLSGRIALSTLLVAGLMAPVAAQQETKQQQAQASAATRRAVPRARAEAPPAARQDAPRREPAPQAVQRTRGTDDQGRARAPRAEAGRSERPEPRERATSRASAPPPTTFTRPEPRPEASPANAGSNASASASSNEEEQRRASPRGGRPRGDNPAVGRAQPRDGRSDGRARVGRDGRGSSRGGGSSRVYTSRGRVYNNHYYYPRRWYPYGYGAFGGLGYFYYDPYTWYSYDPYYSRPYYGPSAYYGHGGYGGQYYDTGELRIQVSPRHAEVYVDGYFAGNVDDFDGTFQALRLEEGPYKIEIVAPGFETMVFDIRIQRGRKITYRGELRPRP